MAVIIDQSLNYFEVFLIWNIFYRGITTNCLNSCQLILVSTVILSSHNNFCLLFLKIVFSFSKHFSSLISTSTEQSSFTSNIELFVLMHSKAILAFFFQYHSFLYWSLFINYDCMKKFIFCFMLKLQKKEYALTVYYYCQSILILL